MPRFFRARGRDLFVPARHIASLFVGLSCLPVASAIAGDLDTLKPGLLVAQAPPPGAPPEPGPSLSLDLDVIARQLDVARSQIQPGLGATVYSFGRETIETTPQGDNQPLNQLILQAPGVVQDSFGQLHIRGDHANIQYRINGVQLPEGINVFGQALQTRLANSVALITGALPAQYGFRTAGIIDIQTKTGTLDPGGAVTLYGGMQGWFQPSFEYGGRQGPIDYYVTGEYLHNAVGIENPTSSFNAIHDLTDQGRGFAYISGIIDPETRLTGIFGTSRSQYQIPNVPNMSPGLGLTANGVSDFNSTNLNENQRQITHYAIGTLQKHINDTDFQVSVFNRYSSVYFSPDPQFGDLLFNGISPNAYRRSIATGTQGDGSYRLSADHILRAGFFMQGERAITKLNAGVLGLNDDGSQTSDQPFSIVDNSGRTGWLYGLYLQDEWKALPNLTVNYGFRFDIVDAFTHENQISPRINVVWQPFETTTLKAGYSRYFTPPPMELVGNTTVGAFANTTGAPPNTLNSTVKAERADYFDIGASQILLPGLKAGVDFYYKWSTNLIDEGQFGAPIILTPFNYAHGINRGAELSISYDIDEWHFYGNFAASKAIAKKIVSAQFNFDPADLAYINDHYIHPDHDQTFTASAGIAYTLPVSKTRFAGDMIHGAGLRADGSIPNGNSLPDYNVVNLSIVQKVETPFWRGLEIRLDVLNLFDETYQIRNGTGVGVGASQFGLRRTVLAGLTQRF